LQEVKPKMNRKQSSSAHPSGVADQMQEASENCTTTSACLSSHVWTHDDDLHGGSNQLK